MFTHGFNAAVEFIYSLYKFEPHSFDGSPFLQPTPPSNPRPAILTHRLPPLPPQILHPPNSRLKIRLKPFPPPLTMQSLPLQPRPLMKPLIRHIPLHIIRIAPDIEASKRAREIRVLGADFDGAAERRADPEGGGTRVVGDY